MSFPVLHALAAMAIAVPPPPQQALVPQRDLVIENPSGVAIPQFYPAAALRAGAQTRVTAICRVRRDGGFDCRDAAIDLAGVTGPKAWLQPEFDAQFIRATLNLLAKFRVGPRLRSGGTSVGREAKITVNWAL